jgi:mRNA interferase HigB
MPATDLIKNSDSRFIFNIKGNHYRLLAVVRFQKQRVYIRGIFTHAEYSKLTNKELLD